MKLRTKIAAGILAVAAATAVLTGCQQTGADCLGAPATHATAQTAGYTGGGGFRAPSPSFRAPTFKAPAPSFRAPSAPKPQRMNPAPKPAPKPQQKPAPRPSSPDVHNHYYQQGGSGFPGFLGGMGLGWLIGQSGDNGQGVCQ